MAGKNSRGQRHNRRANAAEARRASKAKRKWTAGKALTPEQRRLLRQHYNLPPVPTERPPENVDA